MSDSPLDDSLLGRTVAERFVCEELLGVGGMGRVYRARQLSVDRAVALKVLRAESAGNREAQERFMREARTVAGISHPGVVQLVDFGKDVARDLYFLAMEFVEGVPLSSVMKLGRIRRRFALDIARQIASALAQAHSAGVIHRDLKPDNVMLVATADGALQVKVLDFGIALPFTDETRLTKTGAIVGTPHYIAPEQAQDLALEPATDLYALGVILYEMLVGRLPFEADTPLALLFKHVQTPPPDLADELPGIRADLAEFVRRLLAKTPAERPDSAGDVAASLREILSTEDEVNVVLTTGATRADAFLPLVEVQRATSRADDVFGATVDSSPVLPPDESAHAEPVVTGPEAVADVVQVDPSTPEQRTGPSGSTTVTTGPGTPGLLAILLVLVVGIGVFAWVALEHLSGEGEDVAVAQSSAPETSSSSADDVALAEGLGEARAEVRLAVREADRANIKVAAIPAKAPAEDTKAADENEPGEGPVEQIVDEVTKMGPRADEVEIPPTAAVKKPSGKRPPRIPPPRDEDTLQRRIRAAGGMCTGDNKCQIDATELPGHAVCKDDSTCVARCPNGGCIQFCQDRATCWFSCEGGKCQRMVDPNATMTEFKD